ncbi:MAG: putative manganese-dependent inorganic diphosphatase [Lachnospiraceae bacterium]|nr:putative manganese-dependent inorganic diphosphatase [Lachnospiraceae bacterium]
MEQKQIHIVGHKNPDTDSICSALAYAYLKNIKEPGRYIANRAGAINNETKYVLDYFNVNEPELLSDVNVQIRDIEIRHTTAVRDKISLKAAWELMRDEDVVTLPIIHKDNKLKGLITINDIAKSYMDAYDNTVLGIAKTPISNLLEVLDGRLVCGNPDFVIEGGKVFIGAANLIIDEACIEEDDIVLVVDREETQREAIKLGASCLIVSLNAKVEKEIIDLANEHNCNIITTFLDTYSTARVINQSLPIRFFMRSSNLITFDLDDTLENVKDVMSKLRHRDFPIVDDVGNYCGMVSRRNLLAMKKKQVILVDHNERTQAVNGIENAEILEIIDHHRIGTIETINPVYFRNQPVGCTGTILYQMYMEQKVTPPKDMAGLMCSAILSDTLMFRSPTCTPLDKEAAKALSQIADIDIESYAVNMFEAGSSFKGKTPEELLYQDFKTFDVEDITFGVGQISSMNKRELKRLAKDMDEYLKDKYTAAKCDMIFFVMTNILDEGSTVLCYGEDSVRLLQDAFELEMNGNSCYLEGVVSRKKQIVPRLVEMLQQWEE